MSLITSRDNPKIKTARSLRQRKGREATGLFIIEGIHPVGEAVEATGRESTRLSIEYVLYAPEMLASSYAFQLIREQEQSGTPCYPVTSEVFASAAEKENPQGILAIARLQPAALSDYSAQTHPWCVGLVAPQDPGNIGTILRTMDAVGAAGLILVDNSADPTHPGAVRASMGTLFSIPVATASFQGFAAWARSQGYTIYGTSARGSTLYREVKRYQQPAILLMGSEREGLTPEQLACCHQVIRLPMRGRASSLNLAVAAGVMLYAMLESIEER